MDRLLTSNAKLQEKLEQLTSLANTDSLEQFVRAFVPLDLTEAELADYTHRLQTDEAEWTNLKQEILAITSGQGVTRIKGDQVKNVIFHFRHPVMLQCDREVAFVCVNDEWRAEG
mmetsp:Transcript_67361/g.140354  ORF Transcript_67361/g.140354 Transcript_67361/m.140354 type:complete len:115 (+) Transcript_67361:56-400(+)